MTNRSFLFEINQDKYIMRIPGEGTDQLINRKEEYEVYQVIKDLNISDEVIYMNPQNGYKITKYLNDTRVCNQDDQEDLRKCMQLLKYFHQQDLKVDHEFNVFEKIDFYEKLRGPKSLYKDYDQTKEKGTDITLSDIEPEREGYIFKGWSTNKEATTGECKL